MPSPPKLRDRSASARRTLRKDIEPHRKLFRPGAPHCWPASNNRLDQTFACSRFRHSRVATKSATNWPMVADTVLPNCDSASRNSSKAPRSVSVGPTLFDDHDKADAAHTSIVAKARAFQDRRSQGPHQAHRRRTARPELPLAAWRSRHRHPQHHGDGRFARRHLRGLSAIHPCAGPRVRTAWGECQAAVASKRDRQEFNPRVASDSCV